MTLEIETETTGRYADASEGDLHRLVSQLDESNCYVVLHGGDGRFAQAALERRSDASFTGKFIVEYALKSGTLRQATVDTTERAYELLAGWAYNRSGWKKGESWVSVDTEYVVDLRGGCAYESTVGGVRCSIDALGIEAMGTNADDAYTNLEALFPGGASPLEDRLAFHAWASTRVVKQAKVTR